MYSPSHWRSFMGFVKQKSDGDQIIEEPQIILTTAERQDAS